MNPMRTNFIACFVCLLLVSASGCKRHDKKELSSSADVSAAADSKFDVCGLLTNGEVERLQGSPVKEAKSSNVPGALQTWQCFYVAEEFSKSVNLSVTKAGAGSDTHAISDFWKQKFTNSGKREETERESERESDREKRESLRDQREEHEKEGGSLLKVDGVGDDAYWS